MQKIEWIVRIVIQSFQIKMQTTLSIIFFLLISFSSNIFASYDSVARKIAHIEKKAKIKIGVSAIYIETGKFFHYKQDERFKMASSVKLPIAIYLLHLVESGKIKLTQMVNLNQEDLSLGSSLVGYYLTHPGLSMSVANLLEPMMAISDNTTTDAIIKLVGGTERIFAYLKQKGFEDISVNRSIMGLYKDTSGLETIPPKATWRLKKWLEWRKNAPESIKKTQYREFYEDSKDTATPRSMSHLMVSLFNNLLLNKENTDFLLEIMQRSWDGHRISRFLPKNVKIAHKTGTWWDTDIPGAKYGYCNDVAIIYLPNNKGHIAIAVYSASDRVKDIKTHAIAIGKVTKLVYDEMLFMQ